MGFKNLSSLAISLIGFYSIFSAILLSGTQLSILVFSLFQQDALAVVGFMFLALIPQFMVPAIFGVILIRKSAALSGWLLSKVPITPEETIGEMRIEVLAFLSFSTLGLYMLSTTIPSALMLYAGWFSTMAAESRPMGITSDGFWDDRLPEFVYHFCAIGFSCIVFFKSVSLSRFVVSLRNQ